MYTCTDAASPCITSETVRGSGVTKCVWSSSTTVAAVLRRLHNQISAFCITLINDRCLRVSQSSDAHLDSGLKTLSAGIVSKFWLLQLTAMSYQCWVRSFVLSFIVWSASLWCFYSNEVIYFVFPWLSGRFRVLSGSLWGSEEWRPRLPLLWGLSGKRRLLLELQVTLQRCLSLFYLCTWQIQMENESARK